MRNQTVFNSATFFLGILCFATLAQPVHGLLQSQAQDRRRIEAITRELTAPEFNGRAFKSEEGLKAAGYIAKLFSEAGLRFVREPGAPISSGGSYLAPFPGAGTAVLGIVEGRDATLKKEYVIVGAHYDGFGKGFVGATDNAAGVAVMIEIARALAKTPPQRSLLFIAFDGGEQNNAGANHYAEHPIVPLKTTAAMINLSGFGRGMSEHFYETLYVIGSEHSPQLREAISKHKGGDVHLAMLGRDVTRLPGCEHFLFTLKQTPTITITNGVHYAYHAKDDTPDRINYAALEKHVAALTKVIAEIANTPGKIEKSLEPVFDGDEAMEWGRVLTALRENILKKPENDAGQARIGEVLLELKRHQNRPVQDPQARESVILPAASIAFYITNPSGVKYNSLLNQARNYEENGERQQAIAAYQKLLEFIAEEYRRDDQTVGEIRARLAKLGGK
ncbi:MAG: M28 family peptidase [Blastocatellia bacterium]